VFLDLAAAPISDAVIEELAEWIAERIGFPADATNAGHRHGSGPAYPKISTGTP
jgi:hypothetical protein